MGLEPTRETPPDFESGASAIPPLSHGADNGIRTRNNSLEGCGVTITLYPQHNNVHTIIVLHYNTIITTFSKSVNTKCLN